MALGEFLFGIRHSRERIKLEQWIEAGKATRALAVVDGDTTHHVANIREEFRAAGTPLLLPRHAKIADKFGLTTKEHAGVRVNWD